MCGNSVNFLLLCYIVICILGNKTIENNKRMSQKHVYNYYVLHKVHSYFSLFFLFVVNLCRL